MKDSMVDLTRVQLLRFPEDKAIIAQLDLLEMQCWYAGQEPRHMIYLGNSIEFKRFWKLHYLLPLKIKRFIYRIKALFRAKL